MNTNLLIALTNLVKNPICDIVSYYNASNRANGMGDALECYIKDMFCGTMNEKDEATRNDIYSKQFSYLGNQNNPPDIIIKGGDAIEVKKIESLTSGIALNSSYPKDKLYASSHMITQACKDCEDWSEKDIIYVIGVANDSKLKALWFVYGNCYAANKEVYERIKGKISNGINELKDVEFSETRELGRVNRVDPLGITYLRIRGMWHIENPIKVFDYVAGIDDNSKLSVNALLLKDKYLSFSQEQRDGLEKLSGENVQIDNVMIKSPNNPAQLLEAKLIKMKF
jgi:hypothetical protein